MDPTRVAIIAGMSLVTYVLRVVPQLIFLDSKFPAVADRYLRYLAYALVVSIISTSLFLSGGRFDSGAAPGRAIALLIAMAVAIKTRSTLAGMMSGTVVALLLSWLATG